jgi:hypothetical protein
MTQRQELTEKEWIIEDATKLARDLGHRLKPWGQLLASNVDCAQCEMCGMAAFVDMTARTWGTKIAGPAVKHKCSTFQLQK